MKVVFPIMHVVRYQGMDHATTQGFPKAIAVELVEPHRRQAEHNHGGQSLERLAERGGLSPIELWCVLRDKEWNDWPKAESWAEVNKWAEEYILVEIAKHEASEGLS